MCILSYNLKFIPNLVTLNNESNKIGFEGIKYLSNNLRYVPCLSVLNLSCINNYLIGNNLEDKGIISLSENLINIPNLQHFYCECI